MTTATLNIGTVVQVIGPVLDVEFEPEQLPEIYNALLLEDASGAQPIKLVAEVQQHIGQNQVRAVAMSSTDGVVRGMQVTDTGSAITVPVGDAAARPDPERPRRAGGWRRPDSRATSSAGRSTARPRSSSTSSRRPRSSRPASRSST